MYQRHKLRFKCFVINDILHIFIQASKCFINVKNMELYRLFEKLLSQTFYQS